MITKSEVFGVRGLLDGISKEIMSNMPAILYGRGDIKYKPDGSPVTSSDLFVERLIQNRLQSEIPGIAIIGEETYNAGQILASNYVAVVDPIDGTENFCSGLPEWGVCIGIWKDEQHIGSMLFLPELNLRLMTGDEVKPRYSRITGLSSSISPDVIDLAQRAHEVRITGCAAYNLYNVINGIFARFVNPKGAYIWDLLPGIMIACEHGCNVLLEGNAYDGKFLEPSRRYRVDVQNRHHIHSRERPVSR